jgi:hypothetical protein
MPPKKQDKNKGAATASGYTFVDEDMTDVDQLPALEGLHFVALKAFKTRQT